MIDRTYLISHALQHGLLLLVVLTSIERLGRPSTIPAEVVMLFAGAYALHLAGSLFWTWWPLLFNPMMNRRETVR